MNVRRLIVHVCPPWQFVQPADWKSARPSLTICWLSPCSPLRLDGPLWVRTALRCHSRIAVAAGTATLLPGSVTVTCGRSALGLLKLLRTQNGVLMSPLSAMIRPWLGENVLVVIGGGRPPARHRRPPRRSARGPRCCACSPRSPRARRGSPSSSGAAARCGCAG